MNYYKILSGSTVIDANFVFLRWQRKHNILLACPAHEAQYIQSSDQQEVWRVNWLNPLPDGAPVYPTVTAVEISAEEYRELRAKLDDGLNPEEPAPEIPEEEPVQEPDIPQETVMDPAAMRRRIIELEEAIELLLSGVTE